MSSVPNAFSGRISKLQKGESSRRNEIEKEIKKEIKAYTDLHGFLEAVGARSTDGSSTDFFPLSAIGSFLGED
jgi:hypothetical protein